MTPCSCRSSVAGTSTRSKDSGVALTRIRLGTTASLRCEEPGVVERLVDLLQ